MDLLKNTEGADDKVQAVHLWNVCLTIAFSPTMGLSIVFLFFAQQDPKRGRHMLTGAALYNDEEAHL